MASRNEKGQFIKGHKGGPGRPPLADELPLIEGIKAATSAEKVAQVLDVLFKKAVKGDKKAGEIWLAYAVGRPRQVVEMSGPNGRPIEVVDHARDKLTQQLAGIAARLAEAANTSQPDESGSGGVAL